MLLTVDLDEYFIDAERIAAASVFSFQSTGIYGTKLDTPETNRTSADTDSSFSEEIFDVAVTQVESAVQPNCVTDDIWRGTGVFYMYSSTDSTSYGLLTWQYLTQGQPLEF
ncbi:MAG: hypothetical protein ACI8UP_001653 [Porticoccaceae bacterium]